MAVERVSKLRKLMVVVLGFVVTGALVPVIGCGNKKDELPTTQQVQNLPGSSNTPVPDKTMQGKK